MCCLLNGQAGNDPKCENVSLWLGEGLKRRFDLLGDKTIEGLMLHVATGPIESSFIKGSGVDGPSLGSSEVDQPPMRDHECPRAERALRSFEAMDVPRHLKKSLRSHIFGVGGSTAGDVSGYEPGKVLVDPCPGPLLSPLSCFEDLFEGFV